jgi:two-component system alkaline phosphatase synthesis response regulator PhoP
VAALAPVVLVADRPWIADTRPADLGVAAIVPKPFDLDDLLSAVRAAGSRAEGAVTVLVVDDDAGIRALLVDFLAVDLGLAVAEARDGAEALAIVDRERPALVLLDLMMPVLDGLEVCRRLKADPATRAIPAVAISAAPDWESALACGCGDFVAKPFDLDALKSTLRRWLPALGAPPPRRRRPALAPPCSRCCPDADGVSQPHRSMVYG